MELDLLIISITAILFSAFVSIAIWRKKHNTRDWITVNAQVIKIDKEVNHVGFGKTTDAILQYRYEYKGKEYTGNKLNLFSNYQKALGNWDPTLYLLLVKEKEKNRDIDILMNPMNPEESVVSNAIPADRTFMLWIFGAGGIVILVLDYIF